MSSNRRTTTASSGVSSAPAGSVELAVLSVRRGHVASLVDVLAAEVPVALVYNDAPYVVMMATPCDLEDFALGFSLSEGLIDYAEELQQLRITPLGEAADDGFQIDLRIPAGRWQALSERRRNLSGRSGCGLCGAQSIAGAIRHPRRVAAGRSVEESAVFSALHGIRRLQAINTRTGATHAAAWAQADGRVAGLREDVGRHNALDKLIGAMVAEGRRFDDGFALITSRASYEMVLKSAVMGIGLVAAISAPTAFAVRLAEEAGMTLIGFARDHGYVVYSCPARLRREVGHQHQENPS